VNAQLRGFLSFAKEVRCGQGQTNLSAVEVRFRDDEAETAFRPGDPQAGALFGFLMAVLAGPR
jgi:hypothetical protein